MRSFLLICWLCIKACLHGINCIHSFVDVKKLCSFGFTSFFCHKYVVFLGWKIISQPAHDVPGTSPEGPLKVLTSGTYRGPSRDQYENWWFNEKKCFLEAIILVLYMYSCFYWKNKYSKVLNRDVHRTSTGPSYGTPRGPNNGTS